MRTIYKYNVALIDSPVVYMPEGNKLLSVQMRYGAITLWAEVETAKVSFNHTLRIIGTGNPIDNDEELEFIDTVQDDQGFVWHVFKDLKAWG